MKDKLNTCINLLTKAKELVSASEPNIELALDMLYKSQEILAEFNLVDKEEKVKYKEQLLQIQALGQIINKKLAIEKNDLQKKMLRSNQMSRAVKGYSRG